ncbi:unnamed protein product [Allacma fusca]|uniref:Uncharacterized protein n=1 Tax=Allacma fusca TaxID=39272 RepID=A0A8J2JBX6_9HEXA|nr:unnamed protein product [Allacma fusca]
MVNKTNITRANPRHGDMCRGETRRSDSSIFSLIQSKAPRARLFSDPYPTEENFFLAMAHSSGMVANGKARS